MGRRVSILYLCGSVFFAAHLLSFNLVHCSKDPTSVAEEHKEMMTTSDSNSQEDSKEKRSQEEIMFGNQQNKPNGLVDDVMGMAEDEEREEPLALPLKKAANDSEDDHQAEGKEESKRGAEEDMMMGSGASNWYSPASHSGMQYLPISAPVSALQAEDLPSTLYDPEESEYRRKRELWSQHSNLRSSLDQMIRKRGVRLPRRSMRLKRQVDMEELLNLFGGNTDRLYDQETQMTPHIFGGRARTVAKRRVPSGHFNGFPDRPYPYVFQHRDNGVLSEGDGEEGEDQDADDVDGMMLLPPNARYVDAQDYRLVPSFRSREEEKDAIQKWLNRHTTPSVFRVSRRSAPVFYPVDYRYIPGFKKRSSFRNAGRVFSGGEETASAAEEGDADLGKWGHVVQVPEAYASPEDVARLYGLANLMAEGDEPRQIRRRAA